jgi:ribosomal protein L3
MEVEDEDTILERLFFKKYGRALPEKEKEKDVDINFVIDLTDDKEEMEVATSDVIPVTVVKTEPAEINNVANVNNEIEVAAKQRRASRRLELIELARARKAITEFGKSLRKSEVIQEKEAPLAAGTSTIADTDTNMSEDVPVSIEEAERAMAESEAEIAATQKVIDEFDD